MADGGGGDGEHTPLITAGEAPGAIPGGLYYESAPPQLVVSPGAGSYTRHLEQQQRRQQQGGLRLARGTGRQPHRVPRRNDGGAAGANDPLGERRVRHPVEQIRQQNPGQEVERAPMSEDDPRFRYYSKLRTMFRSNAYEGMQEPPSASGSGSGGPPSIRVVDEEDEEDGGSGADSLQNRGINDGNPTVGYQQQDSNPFDSFLAVPPHIVPAEYYTIQVPSIVEEELTGCWQKLLQFLGLRDRPSPSRDEYERLPESEETSVSRVEVAPQHGHSSLVTISSLWNTMMGTSLLAMPWAVGQSGLILGMIVFAAMGCIAAVTAVLIVRMHSRMSAKLNVDIPEFSDLFRVLVPSPPGLHLIIAVFSLGAVAGALTVYWMLSSNFLYNTGNVIFEIIMGEFTPEPYEAICVVPNNTGSALSNMSHWSGALPFDVTPHYAHASGIVTDNATAATLAATTDVFRRAWNPTTVPLILGLPLLVLSSFKNATVFAKMSFMGTLNIIFLISLVTYNAFTWGVHVELHDAQSAEFVPMYSGTFFCLSGSLALGLFIHNAVITIVKGNYNQKNNARDTAIAFVLVVFTYTFIGITFYITFPLPKACISDNLLNNFPQDAWIMIVARVLMLIQLVSIFPLLMYILRSQLLQIFSSDPSQLRYFNCLRHSINIFCCFAFVLIAVKVSYISEVIRYVGAFTGAAIIFVAPCLCHWIYLQKEGGGLFTAGWNPVIFAGEILIVVVGIANFLVQFAK